MTSPACCWMGGGELLGTVTTAAELPTAAAPVWLDTGSGGVALDWRHAA
jgi:hypothetical protein